MKAIFYAFLVGLLMSNFSAHALTPNAQTTLYAHMVEVNQEWSHQMTPIGHLAEMATFNSDVDRIQMHLQLVEQELRSRATDHLTDAQKEARIQSLDALKAYWMAGIFPVNNHHPLRIPYFIDDFGTACAVGHLMIESGSGQVAQAIHEEMNQAYIREIPYAELPLWAAHHGFTVKELAWIQPGYSPSRVYGSIGSGADAKVDLLLEDPQGGGMLIAGQFTEIDDQALQHVALYEFKTLKPMGNGLPDGDIHTGIYFNNTWYIGGLFPQTAGPDANILVWDGTDWVLEHVGNGAVRAFTVHNGTLFAGGDFLTSTINRIAKFENGAWVAVGDGFDAPVHALVSHNNQLIAGGEFHQAGVAYADYVATWDGQVWASLNVQGTLIDNNVRALLSTGVELYAAGDIDDSQGNLTFGLAKWTNAQTGWEHSLNIYKDPIITDHWYINELMLDGNSIYLAGQFNTPISQGGTILLELGTNCGILDPLKNDILPLANPDKPITTMAKYNGKIYWGGEFTWNSSLSTHSLVNFIMAETGGSAIDDLAENLTITIFPNPVQEEVFFQFESSVISQEMSLSLYNTVGQQVPIATERISEGFRVKRNGLPAGTYFYQVADKEGRLSRGKLIFK